MDFIMGADISSLQAMEDCGAKFYDFDGKQYDPILILKRHGINYIRLRLWNNPTTSFDRGDYCNLENTVIVAKRIKDCGLKLLLDFHYCDSWADWKSQKIPSEWEGLDYEGLLNKVYEYTKEVLERLYRENAYPDMVQIGNEIGRGILWDYGRFETTENLAKLLNSGIDAVNKADTGKLRAKIMLHIECGAQTVQTEEFFSSLISCGLKSFDCIGLSYYPYWAGDYESLIANMRNIREKFAKPVVIAETAFPYTDESHDAMPNVVTGELIRTSMGLEPSGKNQREVIEHIIRIVHKEPNGMGVFYWEPLWYCIDGVGAMKGIGNEWENQAVFTNLGEPVEGLRAFEVLGC